MTPHEAAQFGLGILIAAASVVILIAWRLLALARKVRVSGRRHDRLERKSSS